MTQDNGMDCQPSWQELHDEVERLSPLVTLYAASLKQAEVERDALAAQLEQEREVSERLMTELNDINGPTSMGEPVLATSSTLTAQALTDAARAMKGERSIIYNRKGWDYAIRFLEERAARLRSASPRPPTKPTPAEDDPSDGA